MIKNIRLIIITFIFAIILTLLLLRRPIPIRDNVLNQLVSSTNGTDINLPTSDIILPQKEESLTFISELDIKTLPTVNSTTALPFLQSKPNRKIAIVTFFTKDKSSQELKSLTFSNFEEYAKRWGFDVIDALEDPFITGLFEDHMKRHKVTHYFKFIVLSQFLTRYDWIMWADGDSIFLNQGFDLNNHLDDNFDAIFSINTKEEPTWSLVINAGHYLLKNSPWTHKFLQECIYMSEHKCQDFLYMVPDRQPPVLNNWVHLCGKDGGYWLSDQGILQWIIMYKNQDYRCHMKFTGFREFNSEFPWYEDGDLVIHFPGKTLDVRKKLITTFLQHVDKSTGIVNRNLPGMEIIAPVKNPSNARGMYDKYYAPMNMPCSIWMKIMKPKMNLGSGEKNSGDSAPKTVDSPIGLMELGSVPAAFQLPAPLKPVDTSIDPKLKPI